MRFAWYLCFVALVFMGACKKGPQEVEAFLPEGAEVSLILLKEISSGGSREGEVVPFLVSEDVRDAQGNVVISRGTIAYGKVTRSRGATVFTALVNQPARLSLAFDKTFDVVGGEVPLASRKGEPGAVLEITRASVSKEKAHHALDQLLASQDTKELLQRFEESFRAGNLSRETIEEFFEKTEAHLKMPSMRRLLEEKGANGLRDLLNDLQRGDVTRIADVDTVLLISALSEITEVVEDVQSRLRGIFKGPNIKAPVGTPFKAYVAEPIRIRILKEER